MKISAKNPGEKATITEGPAKDKEVTVIAKGDKTVAVHNGKEGWIVRPDLEVK
jgi:hypothetical protein